jgi:hypothetical protein
MNPLSIGHRSWLADEYEKRDFIKIVDTDPEPEQILKIRTDLREAGITESVIFPDLDGLGSELNQIWEDRKYLNSEKKSGALLGPDSKVIPERNCELGWLGLEPRTDALKGRLSVCRKRHVRWCERVPARNRW